MRNTIRKGLSVLLAFVIAFASTPSYTFAQSEIVNIESETDISEQNEETGEENSADESTDENLAQEEESTEEAADESTGEPTEETSTEEQTEETLLPEEEPGTEMFSVFSLVERSEGWKTLDWLKTYYESIHPGSTSSAFTDESITVSDYKELIMLSHVEPAEYYEKNIVLNTSSNTNDFGPTIFNLSSEATVVYDGVTYGFGGLCGDENYPYKGTLSVADMTLMTDTPLFVYLSDAAKCSGTLNFTHKYHTTNNLLAERVVHSENLTNPSQWNIVVHTDIVENEVPNYHVGGLVGTLGENARIDLHFTNASGEGTVLSFTANEAAGIFAGKMEQSSSLSVTYSENNPSPVIGNVTGFTESSGEYTPVTGNGDIANVGALVGSMAENSKLEINGAFSFLGSVSATKGNAGGLVGSMSEGSSIVPENSLTFGSNVSIGEGNAGGLVGYMYCGSISLDGGKTVTVSGNTITGSGHVGGLFGYYATNTAVKYDGNTYIVSGVTLSGGKNAGRLFGVLRNVKTDAMTSGVQIEITNITDSSVSSTYPGGNGNYGGLIGCYKADDLSASLWIHDVTVSTTLSGNSATYGGLIGQVANQVDNDASGYSYLEIENITIEQTNNSWVNSGYGGIIGEVTNGHLIHLGSVTVRNSNSSGGSCGGVIGKMQEASVLRLHGTTDLSAVKNMQESNNCGQLVGYRDRALIYAVGSGNDEESAGDYWKFLRMTERKRVSDVGSYGEVLRLDGSKLKEKKLAENESFSDSFGTEEIIQFSPSKHQVTVYQPDAANIASPRDFAALSLYIQQDGKTGGCFGFAGTSSPVSISSNSISGDIKITADIDMSGTGVFGLMRSNDNQRAYVGTFDGDNHTLTLCVGELYGYVESVNMSQVAIAEYEAAAKSNAETYRGCGEIYNQSYLGLWGRLGSATVQKLTMNGYLHFDCFNSSVYAGVITGEVVAGQSNENVTNVDITSVNVSSSIVYGGEIWTSDIYSSGYIGTINGNSNVHFENCVWSGCIKNYKSGGNNEWGTLNGGFISYVNRNQYYDSKDQVTVRISNCTARDCVIEDTYAVKYARYGVLLGQTANLNDQYVYNQFTVEGLTLDNVKISSCATERAGGLLAYGMYFTDFDVTGLLIQNCELSCGQNAIFGGLVNSATGYWRVHTSDTNNFGIKFSGQNRFTGKSGKTTDSNGQTSGLLVALGQDKDKKQAIYLEVGEEAYVIEDSSVILDITGEYFDEFVGNTVNMGQKDSGQHGIVSIATEGGAGLNSVEVYVNRTYKKTGENGDGTWTGGKSSWQNNATRYYYNLDKLRYETGTQQVRDLSQGIDSGEDLLCWSIVNYAASNIDKYFNSGGSLSKKITGTIDLSGLSFYPLEKNTYLEFEGSTSIKFGYQEIFEKNSGDSSLKLNDSLRQHYMMQYGLYTQIVAENSGIEMSVSNLTLQGTIGYDEFYCGALICDNVTGVYNSSNSSIYNITLKISNLSLDGIKLYGFSDSEDYAPLLIRSIGEYTNLTINGLETTAKYSNEAKNSTLSVATSLIGNVGSETARVVNLTFAGIALDGRSTAGDCAEAYGTCNTIFTKAILLHSFQYVTGSGQYNFSSTEAPKITYGQEISNSEGGAVSGRNNDLQFQYYDGGEVSNPWGDNTDTMAVRFATGFLRYVHKGEEDTFHELDINLKVDFFEIGCGTYSDPYIVTDGMQLERLAAYINDGTKLNGMKLQVDSDLLEKQTGTRIDHTTTDTTYANHAMYTVNGGEWCILDENGNTTSVSGAEDKIRSYLSNAYYLITENIALGKSGSYYGIGNAAVANTVEQGKTFSGVIVGKRKEDGTYPVITLKAPKQPGTTFAGLVSGANGCVIKDLVLDYSEAEIKIKGSESCYTNELGNVSFFGGVIGRVLGGDNIIDNVSVKYSDSSVQVTESAGKNNYVYLAAIGGYVGMVGWDYQGGGGVIFRNMPQNNFLSKVTIAGAAVDITKEYDDGNRYYYANPYVGRVTDAYVCYEKTASDTNVLSELDNTDKNYKIPTLTSGDRLSVGQWYNTVSETIEVTVGSPQQLWILSAIVNSGASAMNCDSSNVYYGESFSASNGLAYNCGKVRYGAYDNVGMSGDSVSIPEEEAWWSGKDSKSLEKVSYLVKKYTKIDSANVNDTDQVYNTFPAAHLTGNKARVGITITADCDMSSYGNGFRGIGGSYNRYGKTEADYRRVVLQKFIAGDHTITLGMSNHEYFEEANDGGADNTLRCCSTALFPIIRLLTETGDAGLEKDNPRVFANAVISGSVTKDFYRLSNKSNVSVPNSNEEIFTAGLIGTVSSKQGSGTYSYVLFSYVHMKELIIKGGYDSGGILAYVNSSAARNMQFRSCNMDNLNIEGEVCCGGYIGAFNSGGNNKVVAVNMDYDGNVTGEETSIENSTFSCALGKDNSCGGALLGYCAGKSYAANITIITSVYKTNDSGNKSIYIGGLIGIQSNNVLNIQNVNLLGCSFTGKSEVKCTGGLGGLLGEITSNCAYTIVDCRIKEKEGRNTTFKNCKNLGGLIGYLNSTGEIRTIKRCSVGGQVEQSIKMENADNIGGLVGYVKVSSQKSETSIEECTIGGEVANNIMMDAASIMGGVIGKAEASYRSIMVIDCKIQNLTGASSMDGCSLGGIIGEVNNSNNTWFTISGVDVDTVRLLGYGKVGGMVGYANEWNTENIGIANSSVKNSKIAIAKDDQWNRANSGAAGILVGAGNGSVKSFNFLSQDNFCGYQLKEGEPNNNNSSSQRYANLIISSVTQRTVDTEVTLDKAKALSMNNIGLKDTGPYSYENGAVKQEEGNQSINYTDMMVFISYADLKMIGVTDPSSDQPFRFTAGNVGCWVGYVSSNVDQLELIGISKRGDYLPNADIGYCTSGTGTLIYGDYQDTAAEQTSDTNAGVYPFITTSPVSEVLKNLWQNTDGTQSVYVTGDAASFASGTQNAIVKKILSDYKEKAASNQWNQIYNGVGQSVYESFDTGGVYADKLSDYQTAEASEAVKAGCDTFPILIIDTLEADVITEMINNYVSVVTNTTQTKETHTYDTIEITTYRWDTDHFTCYETDAKGNSVQITPSLNWVAGQFKQVRSVAGKYDNSLSQFTMVDVQFFSPVENDSSIYHIYIPVLVKKVLQFNMYIAAENGTDYALGMYDSLHSTVIASHGESVTLRLTYQYLRTKKEWESSINGGENYLWKFDKAISIGDKNSTSLPNDTWLALVDVQSGGLAYYSTVQEDAGLTGNVLTFSQTFPEWFEKEESYFCSILPLQADENADSGEMVETTKEDATIYVDGKYYRLYNVATDEGQTRYHITCTEEDTTSGAFKGYVEVAEYYFLTICTPKDAKKLLNANAGFSTLKGGIPTRKNNTGVTQRGTENNLVIGNFFAQNQMAVTTYSDANDKLTDEMPTVTGEMEIAVDFSGDTEEEKSKNKSLFIQNSGAVGAVWQQFSMQMKEYDANGKSKMFTIPVGTKINVKKYEISYTDSKGEEQTVTLDSEEYVKIYSVSEVSKVSFEPLNIKNYLQNSNGGVRIKMYFEVTFSEEGLQKLPKRANEQSSAGVAIRGLSKISYEQSGLANAAAKDGEGTNHYWSTKDASASLTYYACEYDDGLSTGYTSRLGINALEDDGAGIVSAGFYEMSVLENISSANGIHYTLQLLRKKTGTTYEAVDMRDYLSDVTIQDSVMGGSVADLGTGIGDAYKKLVYNEQNKCAELYLDWDGSAHSEDLFWNVPVTFEVQTGWKGNATQVYSNYKVVLSVEIGTFNDQKTEMTLLANSHAEDYIIYTNAKIFTGIIPVYNENATQ